MQKLLRYVIILIAIVILVLLGVLLFNRSEYMNKAIEKSSEMGFNIQEIELFGRENTTFASITNIINAKRGTPIFAVDIHSAQQRLSELAWVKKATVKRILPDKLVVEIEEHVPIAVWQNRGNYYIISEEGQVLKADANKFNKLPIVIGMNAPGGAPLLFSYIDSHFPEVKHRVKALVREGNRRWNIVLDDLEKGIEIKLPENMPNVALEELADMDAENSLLNKGISTIDLRVPDKIMIKFQTNQKSSNERQNS